MRVTHALLRQHIGWHFEKHWRVQGKKKAVNTNAEKNLLEAGVKIHKPVDLVSRKLPIGAKVEVVGYIPKPKPLDNTHPNWHDRQLLTYKDHNVLLEGLAQAKIITKTVEVKQGLPDSLNISDLSKDINKQVKQIILGSHVFDAEQQKLPKVKNPEKPAWNFPRTYGITSKRIFNLVTSKILQLIESRSDYNIVKERYLFNDLFFSFPFEKDGELIQFELRGDSVLTSSKPLSPIFTDATETLDLPNIFPIKHTITLVPENIYEIKSIYPIKSNIYKSHPHTVFVNYDSSEVKNVFEEEVTEHQILGRSLMKSFTVAASYAKQTYGDSAMDLPKPVTVQCVHTDGRLFHFGVLQLNTLNLSEGGIKNVWYQSSRIPLFDYCSYKHGRPILEGYNNEVIKHLCAFYNNV